MNNHNLRKILILVAIILILLGVYLNRAYSHIYGVLGEANLKPVEVNETYLINNMNGLATTTLTYAALGDSLTAGVGTDTYEEVWPYLLAQKLTGDSRQVLLNNHSIPGAMASDVIDKLLPEAIKENPGLVTLLIGANDIHNEVSAKEFRQNYEEILSRLKQETKAAIYVINIPFIGSEELMFPPYQRVFEMRTKEFNSIIKDLAEKYSVQYIDLYGPTVDLFKKSGDHYSKDLFHPSASGYKLWADIIYDHINQ